MVATRKELRKLFEDRLKQEVGFEDKWLHRNREKYFYPVIQTRWEDCLYVFQLMIITGETND